MSTPAPLRVALIGTAFMGRAHSQAWRVAPRMFELPREPEMAVIVGRDPERTEATARQQGWREAVTDWRDVVERDDIDVIDICTPGDSHAEIALAALAAGKHVLCEKPLANTVAEAELMAAAARDAAELGVLAMCGFSYRRTPAIALMQRIVAEGRLGEIRHVRAQYLQDWISDPDAPLTWRLDKEKAGSGALGDIGAHIIDTSQWVSASVITAVSAQLRTFVPTRPVLGESSGLGGRGVEDQPRGPVTVDDAAAWTATFDNGALGVFEATRMALGRLNANRVEINGSTGSIAFDFERMNELEFYDAADEAGLQGFRRIQVTEPEHPYLDAWWPAGHGLGYEHTFVHEVVDLVRGIAAGGGTHPTFDDAAQVQRVLAAVEASAGDESRLTQVEAAR
ncbi:Gfo/Idh/MocA family protein [Homoserinibacter sp. GY 40078]|uniref:Gfo/Idh/MocA family protein n=1 Tax=Homoserinibacter sp. GY 40078 TaxID=2603275 RepID=UPI0011C9FED7|nr:Gfo/Idh/MocA family oxidoreductase [Homoserinibacter sp. GY 40078]TXK18641.1 Gfo/Idh/MocA family oxidoreductase [Homoserinibacter sp. GY 40078]